MRRPSPIVLALAAMLAGCPLPQPLPEYREGQTVTPPRILGDGITVASVAANSQAVILVPAGCTTGPEPSYDLWAYIHDTNTIEQVEARWFVNYNSTSETYFTPYQTDTVPPDVDPLVLVRKVPPDEPGTGTPRPWVFRPYRYPPPMGTDVPVTPVDAREKILRVVELVVSNGFDPNANAPPAALPRRSPRPGFETQVYRWVFLTVPETIGVSEPTDPSCVKCPAP